MTGLGQTNVSNHLACLGCRLVARESRGRFAFYRLAHPWVEGLSLADDVTSSQSSDSCCPICGSEIGGA